MHTKNQSSAHLGKKLTTSALLWLVALLLVPTLLSAQTTQGSAATAEEEIAANPLLAGSNYVAYIAPTTKLTPAPKGYEAFYLTHYARHGSRWLCGSGEYSRPVNTLRKAQRDGKLTAEGQEVLRILEQVQHTSIKRCGDLTTVGERQHHGIGKRMARNFPTIFCDKQTQIDARSTVVRRCILSMIAECEELAAANPNARIHNDTSDTLQFYLNQDATPRMQKIQQALSKEESKWYYQLYQPERLMRYLFTDSVYVRDSLGSRRSLMNQLFNVARSLQGHDNFPELLHIFTPQEIFNLWKFDNISWYCSYGAAVENPQAPFSQYNLLTNFLNTADTIASSRTFHGATLRFGHEVCVLPLACLMELGDAAAKVSKEDFDTLHHVWRNYQIFPMASNIQLVFYRHKNPNQPVLVKALLNEREQTIANLTPVSYPYYKWADVEQYLRAKLADYDRGN